MSNFQLFGNIGFPTSCTYNVSCNVVGKCQGGADIEHHFDVEGKRNVWIQKHKGKVEQNILDYAEWARIRVSNSD
jgi:hypothetical protein